MSEPTMSDERIVKFGRAEEAMAVEDGDTENMGSESVPLDAFEVERVLEAILFAADEPMSVQQLTERVGGWPDKIVADGVARVAQNYKGRGIELVARDGAWAFRSAADVAPYLTSYRTMEKKLSRAAMETLAIIAYHQPVTRAEIENIRGVAVGRGTLDLLIEAGWIQPGRRREVPGRPLTWKTSRRFLDYFGLESLVDLPGIEDLKAAGLLDRRPAIETVPMTGEMFDDDDDADAKAGARAANDGQISADDARADEAYEAAFGEPEDDDSGDDGRSIGVSG